MRLDRVFCRLCECPVVDGGVQASEVDKERFEEWCLDVMEEELAKELEEGDVICNFCVWDAEMLFREGVENERSKWWPNKEELRTLKIYYQVEKVKPCWVLLEKVSLPDSDEEEEIEVCQQEEKAKAKVNCIYCGEQKSDIRSHITKMHKDVAIRCDFRNCTTYFHTLDEKQKHVLEIHETPKERKLYQCLYCGKMILDGSHLGLHIRKFHSDIAIRCKFFNCHSYFQNQSDLKSHVNFAHVENLAKKIFECSMCEFETHRRCSLISHISCKHLVKTISCQHCDKMFSTTILLKVHVGAMHKFRVCSSCQLSVPCGKFSIHFKKQLCLRCKNFFPCSGKLQSHLKHCKDILFSCESCPKSFKKQCDLDYHMKALHRNPKLGLKYKNLGFKCEYCEKYFNRAKHLKNHVNIVHNGLKWACAHCPKKYKSRQSMQNHLAMEHDLIEKNHNCFECNKKFMLKQELTKHVNSVHMKIDLQKCRLCGKSCKYIKAHMLQIHGVRG